MLENKWIKLEDERPRKDGSYMTLWSNPYQKTGSNQKYKELKET